MRLLVLTQCRENYGAHNWDGEGECPQSWRMKGGDFYVVEGVNAVTNAMPMLIKVTAFVEVNNEAYTESIRHSSLIGDDETPWEKWESPYILKWNGNGFDVTREYSYDNRCYWRESWTGLPDGERVDGSWKQVPINDAAKKQLEDFNAMNDAFDGSEDWSNKG